MVMAKTAIPNFRLVPAEEFKKLKAMLSAGIYLGNVEISQGINGGVIRKINGISRIGIRS